MLQPWFRASIGAGTMAVRVDRRAVLRGLARAAVFPAAAFAVHQLRYLLAFGGAASLELQRQGHLRMQGKALLLIHGFMGTHTTV